MIPPIQREHLKWFKWAAKFTQTDLGAFRPGDWSNVRQELSEFMGGNEKGLADAEDDDNSQIRDVQKALKLDLTGLAFDPKGNEAGLLRTIPLEDLAVNIQAQAPDKPFSQVLLKPLDLLTQARFALFTHLLGSQILPSQLRVCLEDAVIFVLERKPQPGKQYFCSPRCARRASSRAFYQRHNLGG
jgi:hypothetical protein